VLSRGLVDAARVGPDAEVTDAQYVVEAHAKRLLEGKDIGVELVHGSVDVAGGTNEHNADVIASKSEFFQLA
jgi:hypothetical protein